MVSFLQRRGYNVSKPAIDVLRSFAGLTFRGERLGSGAIHFLRGGAAIPALKRKSKMQRLVGWILSRRVCPAEWRAPKRRKGHALSPDTELLQQHFALDACLVGAITYNGQPSERVYACASGSVIVFDYDWEAFWTFKKVADLFEAILFCDWDEATQTVLVAVGDDLDPEEDRLQEEYLASLIELGLGHNDLFLNFRRF